MHADDDLEGRVRVPISYAGRSKGPVTAFEIKDGDALRGYVWFADDPSAAAAGTVPVLAGTEGAIAVGAWGERLRQAFAAGLPAADAVLALRGAESTDPRSSRVGSEPSRWADDRALDAAVNPPRPSLPTTRRGAAPTRADVDAVLTGRARSTPEVEDVIASLDAALAGRPTPDPIVVWFPSGPDRFGGLEPVEGMRIDEPTYLTTRFDTPDADLGDAPLIVKVRVPAGVPALWVEHAGGDPAAPGTLMIGRGLRWTVARVVHASERTVVFGRAEEVAGR